MSGARCSPRLMLSCMHLVLEQLLQCNAQTFVELLRMDYNLEIQHAAVTKTGTHMPWLLFQR